MSPTGDIQFDIEYDFKHGYCQLSSDGVVEKWPAQNHITRMQILVAGNTIVDTLAVFEHGRWMPTLLGSSCSSSTQYTIQLLACPGNVATQNYSVTITPDDCAQTEPVCSSETSMGPGDVPIGFQAGASSLNTSAPIRSERPVAGPLAPDFNYGGNNPANGGAGRSWFFTYGQTLVANGTTKAVWTDDRGFRTTFAGNDASGYQASNPADAEGSVAKIGSDYEL